MRLAPRMRALVVALGALVGAGVTARLGLWQLDRAAQREGAAAAVAERAHAPVLAALPALEDAAAAAPLLHRRVRLGGHWSAGNTVWLDNRALAGRAGFFVVTPLVLDDGRALLVQRGWQPRDQLDRGKVAEVPSAAGRVEVEGRLAPPPSRLYEFEPAAGGRVRQNLDPGEFARETGLRLVQPVSLLQSDSPSFADDGLRRDWPAPDAGAAKNRGYAVQWFGLSALITGLYVWFQLVRPRRPPA